MTTAIDHLTKGLDRLAVQYSESTNFINYLSAILREHQTLEDALQDILNNRSIDTAFGIQLDIIGEIVGQPRILVDATAFQFFGFEGTIGALSFGTLTDAGIGGRFRSVVEQLTGNRLLVDTEYRTFIRARIIANYTNGTIEDMISAVKNILPGTNVVTIVEDAALREVTINVGRTLTANEQQFLSVTNLIPKPIGVKLTFT